MEITREQEITIWKADTLKSITRLEQLDVQAKILASPPEQDEDGNDDVFAIALKEWKEAKKAHNELIKAEKEILAETVKHMDIEIVAEFFTNLCKSRSGADNAARAAMKRRRNACIKMMENAFPEYDISTETKRKTAVIKYEYIGSDERRLAIEINDTLEYLTELGWTSYKPIDLDLLVADIEEHEEKDSSRQSGATTEISKGERAKTSIGYLNKMVATMAREKEDREYAEALVRSKIDTEQVVNE